MSRPLPQVPRRLVRTAVPAALVLAAVLSACSSSTRSASSTTTSTTAASTSTAAATAASSTTSPPAGAGDVRVAQTKLGKVLVDAKGMTLYLFTKDTATTAACTGVCLQAWPPATVSGTPTAGAGVTGKLTVLKRSDGSMQIEIDGHPLYTFVSDDAPGDTSGQKVEGLWYAVSPSGDAVGDST